MYDRTYELNSGAYDQNGDINPGFSASTPTSTNLIGDPRVYGVLVDVWQLQNFTGMALTGKNALTANSNGGNAGNAFTGIANSQTTYAVDTGFMMMVPATVYFGGQNLIRYYGYISEWDVTFTHWTQWMVPMRCVIDITFNTLPPPPVANYNSTTGAGATAFYPTPTGNPPPGANQAQNYFNVSA
jgi:hypothetical protein